MKACLPALSILSAILLLSLWVEGRLDQDTQLWQAELTEAQTQCLQEDWPAVQRNLNHTRQNWDERQTFLRILFPHSVLDEADTLFAQAEAFTAMEEQSEAMAQLAALRAQLRTLRDMERLNLENIL